MGGSLGPIGGAGLGAGLGAGGGKDGSSSEEEDAEDAEEEAALSKRAAKKQRKRELTEAAAVADTPITSGFGHAMLLKMGWGGQGSGLREDGIAEPVRALDPHEKKRGLAADDDISASPPAAAPAPAVADATPSLAEASKKEGKERESKAAKRAKREAANAAAGSRTWKVELELTAPLDEEAVRNALLAVPNVLWVPRATSSAD
jgi:hypothetical protein